MTINLNKHNPTTTGPLASFTLDFDIPCDQLQAMIDECGEPSEPLDNFVNLQPVVVTTPGFKQFAGTFIGYTNIEKTSCIVLEYSGSGKPSTFVWAKVEHIASEVQDETAAEDTAKDNVVDEEEDFFDTVRRLISEGY